METQIKKHTIYVEDNKKAVLTGLSRVVSIFDKEIEVATPSERITVRGNGLTASELNVTEGKLVIEGEYISSVVYSGQAKKISLRGMFKYWSGQPDRYVSFWLFLWSE